MSPKQKTPVFMSIGVVIIASALGFSQGVMPAAEQNALVAKYCTVCHDDAHHNGGLSLQHFDASTVEPSLAAMMVSKLKANALGASGQPLPDRSTQNALFDAINLKSAGANEWTLRQAKDPATQSPLITASVLREGSSTGELYRLKLTCRPDTHEAEIQLTFAPNPATFGQKLMVISDNGEAVVFTIDGHEKVGNNGVDVTSGAATVTLHATRRLDTGPNLKTGLPERRLSVSNVFPNETIVFPFDTLTRTMRRDLATCFTAPSAGR